MPNATQIIKVVYESAQAEAAARARSANEQKRTKDDADVAVRSAKAVRDTQIKIAKEVLANEKSTSKERLQAEETLQRETARRYRERVDQQVRDAKYLTSVEGRANTAREDAARKSITQWKSQDDAIMGTVRSVGMFAAGMMGLNSAATVMAAILEQFQKLRTASIEGAQSMLDQAKGMRSLSAVMGQTGQPSLTQVAMLQMAAKTMQSPEEAAELYQSAMGKGFGAIQAGLISEPEMKKAALYQGRRQTLYHESPEAMGKILGMLPMMSEKKGQTGEEIEALNQRLDEIRLLAGFTNYAKAVGQVERVSPYVLKGIYTGPMAMALTGAMAMGGVQEEAGTHLEQATTAVTIGMMRARKMKVSPEDEHQYQTTADYFRKLKDSKGRPVTDQMPAHERILAVVDDVMRAEDEATKAGKHFEGTWYLGQQGFVNQEHTLALTSLVGVHRKGLLKQMIDKALAPVEAHKPGEGIDEKFKEAERDPAFADLFAEREEALATAAAFARDRYRNIQMRAAFNRLGGKGRFGEDIKPIMERANWDPTEILTDKRKDIETEAQEKILRDAKKAGVTVEMPLAKFGHDPFLGWEKLFEISQKTGEAGGRILPPPNEAAMEANTKAIEANTNALMGRGAGPGPVVGQPRPAISPVGPPLPGPQANQVGAGGRPS